MSPASSSYHVDIEMNFEWHFVCEEASKEIKMYRSYINSDHFKSQVMAVSLYQFHSKSHHDPSGDHHHGPTLIKLEPSTVKIFTASSNKGIFFDDTSSESDHGSRRPSLSKSIFTKIFKLAHYYISITVVWTLCHYS